ncbi:MAG TPA: pilus assembly protein TadG-related protein [Candidatus Acidoferrales bacterium]|nr:pilus assembly protein TadG-related protein [Candidatus Acidoferrales bacterium]
MIRRLRERGSIMVLFTLMIPTLLIPLTGLAIDATIARFTQARLQAAVDGSVLGAGRLLGTTADPQTAAGEFLAANFRTDGSMGTFGATNLQYTAVYTPGVTKKIDVSATADVPLLFLRILGQTKATVAAAGEATRTDSRIVVVLDNSPSMTNSDGAGSTVFADARNYAAGFVQKFTSSSDEMGLVMIDSSGYVAYPPSNPSWDSTITSTSSGGPKTGFLDTTDPNNLVNQINATNAGGSGYTGTSDALSVAYVELQKAHLKDLAHDGVDYRLNSIVMLTDGLPQSVTVYANNPNDTTGGAANCCGPGPSNQGALKRATGCTNKISSTTPNPPKIVGWVGESRPFTSSNPMGLYQLYSTDSTSGHTTTWYLANPGSTTRTINPADGGGCTSPFNSSSGTPGDISSTTDFGKIPNYDAWGNSLYGTAYMTASQFVDANGNPTTNQLPYTTTFDEKQYTSGTHWSLAFWNAVDSAGNRIRSDANLANRTGDTQNMAVAIYVIGYSGNGGIDQGLLKRVANDKTCSTYNSAQPTGLFVLAGNVTALQNAFNTVYTAILRLAR